jgi:transcriptional regulator with XRE-family HTH domain
MAIDQKLLNTLIAERIIELREHEPNGKLRVKKITQQTLAELLNVPRTTIANIENLRQAAPLSVLYDLALVFDIELNDLLPSFNELNLGRASVNELLIGGKNVKAEIGEELTAIVRKRYRRLSKDRG